MISLRASVTSVVWTMQPSETKKGEIFRMFLEWTVAEMKMLVKSRIFVRGCEFVVAVVLTCFLVRKEPHRNRLVHGVEV